MFKNSFLLFFLINTIIFYILILYYLRSNNSFKPLKFFVYEGLGIGFISFMIVSICVSFNYILQFNTFFIGIISLILIILIYLTGLLFLFVGDCQETLYVTQGLSLEQFV